MTLNFGSELFKGKKLFRKKDKYWSTTPSIGKDQEDQSFYKINSSGVFISTNGNSQPFFPIIGIPDGASLISVAVHGTFAGQWWLERMKMSDASEVHICTSGAYSTSGLAVPTHKYGVIDNSLYTYHVITDAMDVDETIRGIVIHYTIEEQDA